MRHSVRVSTNVDVEIRGQARAKYVVGFGWVTGGVLEGQTVGVIHYCATNLKCKTRSLIFLAIFWPGSHPFFALFVIAHSQQYLIWLTWRRKGRRCTCIPAGGLSRIRCLSVLGTATDNVQACACMLVVTSNEHSSFPSSNMLKVQV